MKSAGKRSANRSSPRPSSGWYPHCANGIAPESYQVSITSGTREASSPHSGHGNGTSSIAGRWGSIPVTSRPASRESSASDPIAVSWPFGHRQMGSGVPQ